MSAPVAKPNWTGDTHHTMAAAQIELLRQASMARRFGRARSLSRTTIELARRAIARTMPGADEREILLTFVGLHYGSDWAERLRRRDR